MIYLFDTPRQRQNFRPLSYTRPLSLARNGIITPLERWRKLTGAEVKIVTDNIVAALSPDSQQTVFLNSQDFLINAACVANRETMQQIESLSPGQVLVSGQHVLAYKPSGNVTVNYPIDFQSLASDQIEYQPFVQADNFGDLPAGLDFLFPWHIFLQARKNIISDFALITQGRKSVQVEDKYTRIYNPSQIFIEEGANIKDATLNAEEGPIYIGKGAVLQEGAIIHSAHAVCAGATINMGAKMRGDSIIGPGCKVGGEVANSVLFGFSNKGHDGYLGNSVLGEWCNLGADTNTSNLKNNYSNVRVQLDPKEPAINTGQLFCGLLMGDHSKAGINTMFNTGTVAGVGCSLFGGGYMDKSIANFTWGGQNGQSQTHQIEQMLETERKVMARRKMSLTPAHEELLRYLFLQN